MEAKRKKVWTLEIYAAKMGAPSHVQNGRGYFQWKKKTGFTLCSPRDTVFLSGVYYLYGVLVGLLLGTRRAMAEFKHLVIAKFKEDVEVEEILKGMEKLVSDIDEVKSFEWGKDMEGEETLRQGFSYVFLMTFEKKEEFFKFVAHPKHVEFSATFAAAIEKIVLLDYCPFSLKPAAAAEGAVVEETPPATAPEQPLELAAPEAETAVA